MATADPLEEQIRSSVEQLARRAVNLYRVRAMLWAVGLALVATLGFVGLDYSLHVEERGWRWLLSTLWLATLVGIAWRWAPDATSFRLTPVQVAQWIERRRPELGDSLSRLLAVNALPEADQRFGSKEFRQAAGRTVDRALAELPWQNFLDKQPTLGAGLFCVVSLAAVALAAMVAGPIASRGMARIALPWTWAPWPRAEQLELVDAPDMIARESEIEVRVIDLHPPLPEMVELEVRIDATNSPSPIQRMPMRVVDEMAVVTLPAMENDFSIRPIGGDQTDGPWHSIRVARQPQLKEYALAIQPPAYTRQSPTELVGQRIDVLSGSRVTLRGKFDERLRTLRAVGVRENKLKGSEDTATPSVQAPSAQGSSAQVWTAILAGDGQSFELFSASDDTSLITEDRRWQFEIETVEGLQLIDTRQWMIHATHDRPPTVTMAPIEPRAITRNASLNIIGSASDDLGLADIDLTWQVTGQPPQSLRLWSAQANDADSANVNGKRGDAPGTTSGSNSTIPHATADASRAVDVSTPWSVAVLSLSVGQTLTVELVARDSAGQFGKSVPQTLEVLDDAAALASHQRQQAEAFAPLRQLLDAQRRNQQALQRTVDVARQVEAVGRDQIETVAGAQQVGQTIASSLARNQDSLARQLQALGDQLQRNQLGQTPLAGEVARLRSQIEDLVNAQLEPALKELDAADQALRTADSASSNTAALNQLAKATQLHQQATDRFTELVDSVAVAESLADVQKQVQELANDQSNLATQTEKLQVDNVLRGNTPAGDALRAGIQSDQQNLARRVEEMAGRLEKELKPADGQTLDPTTQKMIENAQRKLLQRGLSDQMRQATELLKDNRLTDALAAQTRASQLLDEVAAELGGGSSSGLESSSESMQDMASELNKLAIDQQQTADALRRAAASPSNANTKRQLSAQQQAMRENVSELNADPSAQANLQLHDLLDQAAQAIDQAIAQTERDKLADAGQSASQAADQLKSAAQAAQQRAEQLKSQVAEQQMFDLRTLLSTAVKRQEPVVASLNQLQFSANQKQDGTASTGGTQRDKLSVADMLSTEQQLQQQLAQGRQRLQSLDAFDWLLGQCDEELLRTIASLERQRTGGEALASAKAALEMMQAAETAVAEAAKADTAPPEENATGNEQKSGEEGKSQLPMLASLRLLRQMQTLINQQSEQLLGNRDIADEAALARMADRQQALAEQVARLREQLKQQ